MPLSEIGFEQAAHRLRMTPTLLKWFGSYAPRNDRKKLTFNAEGRVLVSDLERFDQHLRADWGHRSVPIGIRRELERESCGRCALCDGTATLEMAHIDRKDVEVSHYFQHPHNLITLCANCHGRYDCVADTSVTHDMVLHAKGRVQAKLMEEVDRQVGIAHAIEIEVQQVRTGLHLAGRGFWNSDAGHQAIPRLLSAASVSEQLNAPGGGSEFLVHIADSISVESPLVSAKLASAADAEARTTWDHLAIDDPPIGMCEFDDGPALVEEATCPRCGSCTYDSHGEAPLYVEEGEEGPVAYFEDGRGDVSTPECETCGHPELVFEFQNYCSYHAHMAGKDWE